MEFVVRCKDRNQLPLNVDVLLAKRSRRTTASHELVKSVHTLHVMHDAERMVVNDKRSTLKEFNGLGVELLHLRFAALLSVVLIRSVEVLASKLSNHDGLIEGAVPEVDVGDEVIRGGTVEMDRSVIHSAATVANIVKLLHPGQAIRVRARDRSDESISLILERLNGIEPDINSILRSHVRLSTLIDLIEAHSNVCNTRLDCALEGRNLIASTIPEHGHALEAESLRFVGTALTPSVDVLDMTGHILRERCVVTVRPGKTDLSISGRCEGTAARTATARG